jgi:hypothetical protein
MPRVREREERSSLVQQKQHNADMAARDDDGECGHLRCVDEKSGIAFELTLRANSFLD